MKQIKLIFCLSFCSLTCFAQTVPGTLSYQGILMQNDGITPLVDGTHSIEFNFYTAATSGILLETRTISVTTTKGLYTCIIGDGTSGNAPLPASLGTQQVYVGIKVDNGAELLPRAQLTTTAYAFQAQSAYSISDNAITSAKIVDGAITSADINDGTLIDADINGSAAIAGTKVVPAFGSQNISTTGTITSGAITATSFSGNGSGITNVLNSATTASPSNNSLAIVARDASGNFSAGTITATLNGNASTVTTNAPLTGDVTSTGNATQITNDAVTSAKLADDASVDANRAVTTNHIRDVAVTNAKLATGIDAAKLSGVIPSSVLGTGSANQIVFWNGTPNALTTNSNLFWNNASSYLGIGTSTVSSILHLNKSGAGNYLRFSEAGTLRGLIGISGTTNDLIGTDADNDLSIRSESNMLFGIGASEKMRISSTGNVGVGTIAPSQKLHVAGAISVNGSILSTSGNDLYLTSGIAGQAIVLEPNGSGSTVGRAVFGADGVHYFRNTAGTNQVVFNNGHISVYQDSEQTGLRLYQPGSSPSYWDISNYNSNNLHFGFNGPSVAYINDATGSWNATSDFRLKENINEMKNVLPKILQLTPKTYNFKRDPDKKQTIGLIAQEVLPLFPETVGLETNGYYSLSTSDFGILSIQGIKELHQIIKEQQSQIEDLRSESRTLADRLAAIESKLFSKEPASTTSAKIEKP